MIAPGSRLVLLLCLVDRIPVPPAPRRRGRPRRSSERLFLEALVVMIVRQLHRPGELSGVLAEPTPELLHGRALLTEQGSWPCRRTWERRLGRPPETLPAQLGCLGRCLVEQLQPWAHGGRAVAIDSTVLHARGGVRHARDRAAGLVPHTSIDPEAHWTRSGGHGRVSGWQRHLVSTVAGVWIPLAAALTPADAADNELAPPLLADLPAEVRTDPIVRDPALLEGQAAFAGTRVPVWVLFNYLTAPRCRRPGRAPRPAGRRVLDPLARLARRPERPAARRRGRRRPRRAGHGRRPPLAPVIGAGGADRRLPRARSTVAGERALCPSRWVRIS
jgi:Protein of unknown function (DUF433)